MKKILVFLALVGVASSAVFGQGTPRDPYNGAIVIDASDGRVLFEDGADRPGYPASMLKLMDLFVILDRVKAGQLRLDETVPVTKEAYEMGGSQVWLDPRESFPVEELLYALMVQSANDAAMALAQHVGGSREGFVRLMNEKARALGLSPVTQFQSPHGLPPGEGQRPDMTTPRDFAKLCQALLAAHPETLTYTSVIQRPFRPDAEKPIIMGTHNALLGTFPGCDGLKTGWIRASGYCLAATVQRDGRRVIAVLMGSATKKANVAKAKELINRCLPDAARASAAPPAVRPAPVPAPAPVVLDDPAQGEELDEPAAESDESAREGRGWLGKVGYVLLGAFLAAVVGLAVQRRLLLR
jgi:D-alanyl-D-alanine carboxypeptidase (penicillin-binding protein 5/6)